MWCLFSHAFLLISHSNPILYLCKRTTHYKGYGGGGGGGGVYKYEVTTVNYDDSMTINVDGGARGEGDTYDSRAGFAGNVGKVFLVSRLFHFSYA
jgi:hypothetical protein